MIFWFFKVWTSEFLQNFQNQTKKFIFQVRKMIIDCDNSDVQQLDVLYATEILDRVYPQTNTYYAECINHANFV